VVRDMVGKIWPLPRRLSSAAGEVVLVGALFAFYNLGRIVAAQDVGKADAHARRILDVQAYLPLPSERSVQDAFIDHDLLIRFAGEYYSRVHFPLTAAVLVFLYVRRPGAYSWAKWSLVIATGAAMVVHVLVPVTPPRLLESLGMVDTGLMTGDSPYSQSSPLSAVSNQYAAMPSLHVGWAVLVAIVLISSGRGRNRWWWVLHPAITLLVVIVTANHYWLDAILGTALVVGALWLSRRVLTHQTQVDRALAAAVPTGSVTPGSAAWPVPPSRAPRSGRRSTNGAPTCPTDTCRGTDRSSHRLRRGSR
jgi:hypothetical protein